jgi:hypothetical protein
VGGHGGLGCADRKSAQLREAEDLAGRGVQVDLVEHGTSGQACVVCCVVLRVVSCDETELQFTSTIEGACVPGMVLMVPTSG